ncbi:MAG: hypothetical protein RLZZ630_2027, partial [Bacteroidota bacterium]
MDKRNPNSTQKLLMAFIALFFSVGLQAQTPEQISVYTAEYDKGLLAKMAAEIGEREQADKEAAWAYARLKKIPVKVTLKDGGKAELMKKEADGTLIYFRTDNAAAARSTRVNHLNTGGSTGFNLDGQNMFACVWDEAHARLTHQEFDGVGGTDRVSVMDATTATLSSHGCHVTGTIVASGFTASAKGMAPQGRVRGYNWTSDLSEATTAASNGMLLSNHSYGYSQSGLASYYFGAYLTVARDWDNLMYNAPYYLMVKSAGNNGTTTYNTDPLDPVQPQYDKLTDRTTCKNNLAIASANDATIDVNGNLTSVTISSFSSQGPTDDLRIKPDIAANGASLYSTDISADNSYSSKSGTSMASPNATGTLLLLQQHAYQTNGAYMRAATLKGLVLHTADDVGMVGPDAIWGWGLMNGLRAARTISANGTTAQVSELILSQGQTYTFTVNSDGINKLMASISWTDPAGVATTALNSTTPRLVNDLDIRISKNGTTYLPWLLTGVSTNALGDNIRDPFERAEVSGASGTYTITVSHKGTLSSGSQRFSLIITGIVPAVCAATVPDPVNVGTVLYNSATLSWSSVQLATYTYRYRLVGDSIWTSGTTSATTLNLTGLSQLSTYEFQVQSVCPDASTSAWTTTVQFTTPEFVITYCNSSGISTQDWIQSIQLGQSGNVSGNNSGYGNFTSTSIDAYKAQAYPITIQPGWVSTARSEGYSVWIDYNNNGSFTDAGEQVFTRSATTLTPISGTITIPLTAFTGNVRMRVSMKNNAIPTACETGFAGEVEDYTLNILEPIVDVDAPTAPTQLAASAITHNSLTLTWNPSVDNVLTTGYKVYRNGTLLSTVTSTTLNVTGLTPNTLYSFYVTANDAAGNTSLASNQVDVTTLPFVVTYCTSNGTSTSREFISRVRVGTIDNTSGNNNGYGNFTALSTIMVRGTSQTITINPGWTSTARSEAYRVWIDYNSDGDFADAGEQVFSRNKTTATSVLGTFTVPTTAVVGSTRMRVSMKYNSNPTSCEVFASGEVEDYTVQIQATPGARLSTGSDHKAGFEFEVYPNPVHEIVFINTDQLPEAYEVIIQDVNGRVVMQAG